MIMLCNTFLLWTFYCCTAAVGKDLTSCYANTKLSYGNISCIANKAIGCTFEGSDGSSLPSITSLRVTSEALENHSSGQYLYSLARISWSLPSQIEQNGDFLVHLQTCNYTQSLCYLITLDWAKRSKAISSDEEVLVEFSLPLQPNCYSIGVKRHTNMPLPTRNPHIIPHSVISVKRRDKANMNIPALWVTDLVLSNDSCNCLISVTFELAPSAYNFTTYIVMLQLSTKKTDYFVNRTTLDVTGNQRQGIVNFTDLTPGRYKILVFPNDTDKNKRSCRCQCRNSTIPSCSNRKICAEFGCLQTVSDVISIDKVHPGECVIVYEDPNMWLKVAGIVAGLVTSFAVILIVIWFLRRPRHIVIDLRELPKQPVFLLFMNDHECHQKVIHHLIKALQRHGNIEVETMYNHQLAVAQNPLDFIEEKCTKSDKILIINSDGMAHYFLTTEDNGTVLLDPLDSQVPPFLSYLRRHRLYQCATGKLIMAQFDYTKPNVIAREVHYHEREHMLMQDFEALLLHLHDLEKRSGRTVYHVANVQNTGDIPEFEKLNSAVLLMRKVAVNESESLDRNSLHQNPSVKDGQTEDEHNTSENVETTALLMRNNTEIESNPSEQGTIENEDEESDSELDQMDDKLSSFLYHQMDDTSSSFPFHPPSLDDLSITSEEQNERLACFYTTIA